ncbi:MAG: hypothetical protein ACRD3N_17090 [Terracidiphilus sp.]
MASHAYENALRMALSLSYKERLRLIQELSEHGSGKSSPDPQHSILELRGLGAEIWQGIDAQEYVNSERASWE